MSKTRCYGCMRETDSPICEYCGYDASHQNGLHQLPAGTVLKEQYLVGRVLGQGGFGITYLGWDLYLDIPVAIKEYFPNGTVMRDSSVTLAVSDCSGDAGVRFRNNKERFLREAKMLARFSQVPEIVQVKSFFLANNTAYIVMEYVEGQDLKHYVQSRGGKLSVEETLGILGPVIQILGKVHKAGLVHRDISPDNIMMLPGGGAKLLDFGAVRDVGAAEVDKNLSKSTEAILKQGYAPIEQYQKRGSLGPWTDVYALCATICYCLTGEVPPDAPERLLGEDDYDLAALVPELTAAQLAALNRGMALRAENRTPSMEVLHQELFGLVSGPAAEQQPPMQPEQKHGQLQSRAGAGAEAKTESRAQTKTEQKPHPGKKTKRKSGKTGIVKKNIILFVLILAALYAFWLALTLTETVGSGDPEKEQTETQSTSGILREDDTRVEGICGRAARWELDLESGTMTVWGTGEMTHFRPWFEPEWSDPERPWEAYREQIKALVIQEGITTVSNFAFVDCRYLETVQFPSTLEFIGAYAFQDCCLEELILPENLQMIDEGAFTDNPMTEVTIPDSVTYLERGCFSNCRELKTVTVGADTRLNYDIWFGPMFGNGGNTVTLRGYSCTMVEDYADIWDYVFEPIGEDPWDATGVENDGIGAHGVDWYFDADTGFLKVGVNSGIFIDYYKSTDENDLKIPWAWRNPPGWMEYREQIVTLSLGEVYHVGSYAFAHCTNLTDVYWNGYCGHILYGAFLDTNLNEVDLTGLYSKNGEVLGNVAEMAFADCKNLTEVRLHPNQVLCESRDFQGTGGTFSGCENLESFWFVGETDFSSPSYNPFTSEAASNVPEKLMVYGLQNSELESIAARDGISFQIGYNGLTAEDSGQCGEDAWWFKSGDTLVVYGTGYTWAFGGEAVNWHAVATGREVAHEGDAPFWQYSDEIRNLVILPGLKGIGFCTFMDMRALETVDFGTVEYISGYAFQWCPSLKLAEIPETVKTIHDGAFYHCDSLEKLYVYGADHLYSGIFEECGNLTDVYIFGDPMLHGDLLVHGLEDYNQNLTFHVDGRLGTQIRLYIQENRIPYKEESWMWNY